MRQLDPRVAVRELCSRSLHDFVRFAWPVLLPTVPFVDGLHIRVICAHLQVLLFTVIGLPVPAPLRKFLINIPPRMAKSTIGAVIFPVWAWTIDPHVRFLTASYADTLARRDSMASRNLINSPWFQKHWGAESGHTRPIILARDQNQQSRYSNTHGGYRLATSVGAATIGEGGDVLFLDDAHSPRGGALTDADCINVEGWVRQVFFRRQNDPKRSGIVVQGQRLGRKDISGILMEKLGWPGVVLPMRYKAANPACHIVTPLGWRDTRKEGEFLSPERFGEAEDAEAFKELMPFGYAGQMDQSPIGLQGNLFPSSIWGTWTRNKGDVYDLPPLDGVIIYVDAAFKGLPTSDPVSMQAWGWAGGGRTYFLDHTLGQMGFLETCERLADLFRKVHAGYPHLLKEIVVESAANGEAIIEAMNKQLGPKPDGTPWVVGQRAVGSKEARAQAWAPRAHQGRVFLPVAPWVAHFIKELEEFPGSDHDDQVDAASGAHAWIDLNAPGPGPSMVVQSEGASQWLGIGGAVDLSTGGWEGITGGRG